MTFSVVDWSGPTISVLGKWKPSLGNPLLKFLLVLAKSGGVPLYSHEPLGVWKCKLASDYSSASNYVRNEGILKAKIASEPMLILQNRKIEINEWGK